MRGRRPKQRPHFLIRIDEDKKKGRAFTLDNSGKLIKDDSVPEGYKYEMISFLPEKQCKLKLEITASFTIEALPSDQWLIHPPNFHEELPQRSDWSIRNISFLQPIS